MSRKAYMAATEVLCVVAAVGLAATTYAQQSPYPGPGATSANLLIQAEDYDTGGEGVSYHEVDATPNSLYRAGDVDIVAQNVASGYTVTMIDGEWLEWTINVPWTGNYRVAVRARSVTAGTADISIGAWSFSGFSLAANSGFQYKQAGVNAGYGLTAGDQVMRMTLLTGGTIDLDCITLVYLGPNDDRSPFPDPANALTIPGLVEAEYFDSGRSGLVYNDTGVWNAGVYLRSTHADVYTNPDRIGASGTGEFQEYTLNATQAGTYRVGVRIKPGGATAAVVKAYVGGTEITPTGGITCPTTTWYQGLSLGTASLPVGSTVFKFEIPNQGSGLDMEAYSFTLDPGTVAQDTFPTAGTPHAVPGTIQAENFDVGGQGVSSGDNDYGNLGKAAYRTDSDMDFTATPDGQIALADLTAGEWAEYTVNIAEAGRYEIEARVAATLYADPATAPKTLQFSLDGTPITSEIKVIPATQGTQAFSSDRYGSIYGTTTVSLPAGQHVLRFDVVQNGGFNLDWIKLSKFSTLFVQAGAGDTSYNKNIDAGHWRFDLDGKIAGQSANTIQDLSANNNDGTAVNGPLYSDEIPSVRPNQAGVTTPNRLLQNGLLNTLSLQFARANSQYVQVNHGPSLSMGNKSFTIEALVKLNSVPAGTTDPTQRQWLVQKKASSATEDTTDYALLVGGADLAANGTWGKTAGVTGNEIVLLFGTGTGYQTVVSQRQAVADGEWHSIVVSYDAQKGEVIFLWDEQCDTANLGVSQDVVIGINRTAAAENTGPLYIGGGGTPGQFFDGQMDELRIRPLPLAGTPGTEGTPNGSRWFWQNEGSSTPNGMIVVSNNYTGDPYSTLYQPWSWRESRGYENMHCFWEVVRIEDGPGGTPNYALHLYDAPEIDDSYLFWDHDDPDNMAREETMPYNMAAGATYQMRFKLIGFEDNGRQSPTARVKFCRMITALVGTDKNAKFQWELDYADVANRTGIALYAGEENIDTDGNGSYDTKWQSPNLADGQWHTLHAAAWAENGNVHQKTWLDGGLVEEWIRKSKESTIDPIFGFNDHLHPHQWTSEAYFDYFRVSGLGAFAPDGTMITPFPEVCNNGIDDDQDGLTDCADADCAAGPDPACCTGDPLFDLDGDGDVDQTDFGVFQSCYTDAGDPAGLFGSLPLACRCMEVFRPGADNDIDRDDYEAFEFCATAPGVAASAACDN